MPAFSLSLRSKLTLLITLLSTVLTLSFTSYYISHERQTSTAQLQSEGNLLASVLASDIQLPLYAGNYEEVAMHTAALFKQNILCGVRLTTASGEQILSAARTGKLSECSGQKVTKSVSAAEGELTPGALLLGEPSVNRISGNIELTLDSGELNRHTRNLVIFSFLLAVVFWFLTTGITFFILKRVTATFEILMAGVKRIETGDLSGKIPVNDSDEPGRAITAINSLAEALQKRNEENQRLQAEVVKGLRLQIDEEKNRHMAKLIQTNRMTSLGLLVSSMAHEINNPNGAIRLAAEILERGWTDVQPILDEIARNEGEFKICGMPYSDAIEDIEKAVDAISRSSIRIEQVIQNLRSYSLGTSERNPVEYDLNRVAENAIAIVRAHGRMTNVTLNTALSPELARTAGNPFLMEQVVINLTMNAIQAMAGNAGKVITISTGIEATGSKLLLLIRDNGTGISEENLPHIFEPFFSTRIDQGGSGLGLYISSFIVSEQNGTLEIFNNEDGSGCCAVIRLPVADGSSPQPLQ